MLIDFLETALNNANVIAAMKVTRLSEGTAAEDGYNYLFGSSATNNLRFKDFSDHPRINRPYGDSTSSAAGAYQILQHTWNDDIQAKLHLPDFSPHSQDLAFCYLVSEKNCLQKLMDGKFYHFVTECNRIWASFPGSPYGQPVHTLDQFHEWFTANGGVIAD